MLNNIKTSNEYWSHFSILVTLVLYVPLVIKFLLKLKQISVLDLAPAFGTILTPPVMRCVYWFGCAWTELYSSVLFGCQWANVTNLKIVSTFPARMELVIVCLRWSTRKGFTAVRLVSPLQPYVHFGREVSIAAVCGTPCATYIDASNIHCSLSWMLWRWCQMSRIPYEKELLLMLVENWKLIVLFTPVSLCPFYMVFLPHYFDFTNFKISGLKIKLLVWIRIPLNEHEHNTIMIFCFIYENWRNYTQHWYPWR